MICLKCASKAQPKGIKEMWCCSCNTKYRISVASKIDICPKCLKNKCELCGTKIESPEACNDFIYVNKQGE